MRKKRSIRPARGDLTRAFPVFKAARALERYIPLVQGPERRKAQAMLSSLAQGS